MIDVPNILPLIVVKYEVTIADIFCLILFYTKLLYSHRCNSPVRNALLFPVYPRGPFSYGEHASVVKQSRRNLLSIICWPRPVYLLQHCYNERSRLFVQKFIIRLALLPEDRASVYSTGLIWLRWAYSLVLYVCGTVNWIVWTKPFFVSQIM